MAGRLPLGPTERTAQLIQKAYAGSYDIYSYRCDWYAVPTGGEPFDPQRPEWAASRDCLRADTRAELERLIRLVRFIHWVPEIIRGGFRRLKLIAGGCLEIVGVRPERPSSRTRRRLTRHSNEQA